jgi:uncharacterized membrane protein
MSMFVATFLAVLIVLLAADLLWLGLVAMRFYKRWLAPVMRAKPNLGIAALFYVVYAAGIVLLAVQPALADGGWTRAAGLGALLGLCAYGAYDLTNLATLRHWSWQLTVVDMAWGVGLTASAAVAGIAVGRLELLGPG